MDIKHKSLFQNPVEFSTPMTDKNTNKYMGNLLYNVGYEVEIGKFFSG